MLCDVSKLTLCFDKGFSNSRHERLKNCKILISIKHLTPDNVAQFVTVRQKRKSRIKEVTFPDFCRSLLTDTLLIEKECYSEFERSILIIGEISGVEYEITVTDIDDMEFFFEQ